MPLEMLDKLHGAIRYLREGPSGRSITSPENPIGTTSGAATAQPGAPDDAAAIHPLDPFSVGADPFAMPPTTWEPEARVAPELASIRIRDSDVRKGSSVRIRPQRRADAMDLFLAGRLATVEAIFESVDDETYVAVTVDDDPAAELHREYGRFFYFGPDELEPVSEAFAGQARS